MSSKWVSTSTGDERALLVSLSTFSSQPRYIFCSRLHITVLGKVTSIAFTGVYAGLFALVVASGNVAAIMFALIVFVSVAISVTYGTFKGSKLCLIPFVFLQIMLLLYIFIVEVLLLVIYFNENNQLSLIFDELRPPNLPSQRVMLASIFGLLIASAPVVGSIYVICLLFEFIAEIDEALSHFRELHDGVGSRDSP